MALTSSSSSQVEEVRHQLEALIRRQEQRGTSKGDVPRPVHAYLDMPADKDRIGAFDRGKTFSIVWSVQGEAQNLQGGRGSIEVPSGVAASFGEQARAYESVEALREDLLEREKRALWDRIVALLSIRDHSRCEVLAKMVSEGYSRDLIEEALQRACACNLIDDGRYGASFVRARVRKGWGRGRIERELDMRGVDPSCIEGYPERFYEDDEIGRARSAIVHKRIPDRNPEQKLARFLVQRGFSSGIAMRVAREYVQDRLGEGE